MKKSISKWILISAIVVAGVLFFTLDLGQYFTLEQLKTHQADFERYYHAHRAIAMTVYFALYVAMAALSLPGAAVLTLAGGALFGLGTGLLLVSFASSLGATLAFWSPAFCCATRFSNGSAKN